MSERMVFRNRACTSGQESVLRGEYAVSAGGLIDYTETIAGGGSTV